MDGWAGQGEGERAFHKLKVGDLNAPKKKEKRKKD